MPRSSARSLPQLLLAASVWTGVWAAEPAAPANLLVNGDFTAGWTGWSPTAADKESTTVSLQSADGNTFLHLSKPTQVLAAKRITLDPTWKKLHVSCRIRLSAFAPNPAISWGNARLANSFLMPDDKRNYAGIVQVEGNTDPAADDGWKRLSVVADIPAGALAFEVICGNYGSAGETDFDDIVVSAE